MSTCTEMTVTGYDDAGQPTGPPCDGPAFGLLNGEPRCFWHLSEASRLQHERAQITPLSAAREIQKAMLRRAGG